MGAKIRVGQRDSELAFHDLSSTSLGTSGPGNPYTTVAGSGVKGPIVEGGSSSLVKITVDISVPATTIGSNINWTSGGIYTASPTTNLVIFRYYSAIDSTKELNGRSNFFLTDVQMFFGSTLTGSSGITGTTTKVNFSLEGSPSTNPAWQANNVALSTSVGRVSGSMSSISGGANRMLGNDFGDVSFYLTGSCDASSPANLGAGRIRLVLLGYEF